MELEIKDILLSFARTTGNPMILPKTLFEHLIETGLVEKEEENGYIDGVLVATYSRYL